MYLIYLVILESCYIGETGNKFCTKKYHWPTWIQHKISKEEKWSRWSHEKIKTQSYLEQQNIPSSRRRLGTQKNQRSSFHKQHKPFIWDWSNKIDEPRKRNRNCSRRLLEIISSRNQKYCKQSNCKKYYKKDQQKDFQKSHEDPG